MTGARKIDHGDASPPITPLSGTLGPRSHQIQRHGLEASQRLAYRTFGSTVAASEFLLLIYVLVAKIKKRD